MSLITGDPSKDIFEQNPELEYIGSIREFIKEHGGKKKASKLLWAVYMTEDPNSKLYRIMDLEERRKEVAENYLLDKKFEWAALDKICLEYGRIALTKEEIFFTIWGQKLDELQAYLKFTDIASDPEQIIKIMEKIPKVLQGYEDTKNKMLAAKKKGKTYGGKQESLGESGQI